MSRDNFERKQARKLEHVRRKWTCKNPAGCTAFFAPAANLAAVAAVPGQVAARGLRHGGPITLVCPKCNTFHFLTADRQGVRLLTPAETFELYVDVPEAATAHETLKPVSPKVAELTIARVEG